MLSNPILKRFLSSESSKATTDKFTIDRKMYAVTKGAYIGEHLVLIEHDKQIGHFLSMPDLAIKSININDFTQGIKSGVLDMMAVLPKDVMAACKEQYKILKKRRDTNV
jgi:hypothetical protein